MPDYKNKGLSEAMEWDDVIEDDGREFIILPEGDYIFTVTRFERGRFPGSEKMAACNKASLVLQVETDKGTGICYTDIFLSRRLEWKIASFFRCIGQKQHGERLVMDWNRVVGKRGRGHFKPETYTSKGEEREKNTVTKFYDYDRKYFPEEDEWMKIPEAGPDDLPFD